MTSKIHLVYRSGALEKRATGKALEMTHEWVGWLHDPAKLTTKAPLHDDFEDTFASFKPAILNVAVIQSV